MKTNDGKPCFCPHGEAVNHEHRWEELERYPKMVFTANHFNWLGTWCLLVSAACAVSVHFWGWGFMAGVLCFLIFGCCLVGEATRKRCCEQPMQRCEVWRTVRCPICNIAKEETTSAMLWRCACCEKQVSDAKEAVMQSARAGDGLRTTGELTIQIPALPRPTEAQLRAKYSWISNIERDTSPTDPVTMNLATVLRPGETKSINGAEYEQRLAPHLNDLLGFQQLEWLVEHQDESPVFKALLGKIYVDGPGIVVVIANGDRCLPYLANDGTRWCLSWLWVSDGFLSIGRVASSCK